MSGITQLRTNTPISRGFRGLDGVERMDLAELVALSHITQWAAEGCIHGNRSALGAQLMADAAWLNRQISARAERATRSRGAA
ncbi:hypothetical protein [Falsiroseomonas sp. E2-1-a20]|uniref:hypothetical protein n=1 Tax=Falsiroseomonas sp. E2-1-a20 TaxID=3239300 RepID=UPI003F2FAF31